MGFGDWLMTGLGFNSKKKENKAEQEPVDQEDKYADFNMHERQTPAPESTTFNSLQPDTFNLGVRDNFIIFSPTDIRGVQEAVDCIRQNQSVMLDLEKIADEDRRRILDFISGAIYGLNGSIHKFKNDSFILTPEGKKILTPNKRD